jgi:hypothetical protein
MRIALLSIGAGAGLTDLLVPETGSLKAIAIALVVQSALALGRIALAKLKTIRVPRRTRKPSTV